MKTFLNLIFGACFFFISCEEEQFNNDLNNYDLENTKELKSKIKNTDDLNYIRQCNVIDVDRCDTPNQPEANFWWPSSPTSYYEGYFSSTDDHSITFTEYNNGSARIFGSTKLNDCVAYVDVWLKDKKDWTEWSAIGGEFKKEGCAGGIQENLMFYVIDAEKSSITAVGGDCLEEGTFSVEQRPDPSDMNTPNYGVHVGPGGANWDSNVGEYGLSGWGWLVNSQGKRMWVMDFNFRLDCVEESCSPCDGKVTDLSLQYNGSIANANVKVKQKKDDKIVFDGIVQPGESFSFTGKDKKGTLGTEIIIYINGVEHTKLHTSCSKPVGPGTLVGDFEIVDGASRNGGKLCPEESPAGDDCNECDGKATNLEMQYIGEKTTAFITVKQKKDDKIVFEGNVMSGNSFSFSGLDKKGTLGTEITLFIDEIVNTKIHTSCSKPIGPGLISGDFKILRGSSYNGGEFCPVLSEEEDEEEKDCGECEGKVTFLEMKYNGDDGSANVRIQQKKDNKTVFEGTVVSGNSFSFTGEDKKGTLGTEIIIYVDGIENTRVHTSCSKPIKIGLSFGDFEILNGASREGGQFCPLDN